jgi:hypothetical protein
MFLIVAAGMTLLGSALIREEVGRRRRGMEVAAEAAVVSAGNVLWDTDLKPTMVWGATRAVFGF